MNEQVQRINDLVIEASAVVDWLETGRGDVEIVGAALLHLRDRLCALAAEVEDAEARDAAWEMIGAIDRSVTRSPQHRTEHRAA